MSLLGPILKRSVSLANKIKKPISSMSRQEKTLTKLLKKAQDTAFGQHYGFEKMLNSSTFIEDFRRTIPISDYDLLYKEWWHRILAAEPNVTWHGKVNYFALSSGTTGAPSKYLPMTKEMIRSIRNGSFKTLFAMSRFPISPDYYTKQVLVLSSSTSLREQNGYYIGDMSGINAGKAPNWLNSIKRPEPEIAKIADWETRINEIARNAKNWNIGSLTGIPSWVQLMIERVCEYNKAKNIHEVWPNLEVFVHGGLSFEPYRSAFEQLMGKPMIYVDTYLASEGYLAYQMRPETRAMGLVLNNGVFFEFIPFNDENFYPDGTFNRHAKAYTINEVKEGIDYALVISTCAGTWRYLIGDTVRFTDVKRCEIIITGRTKHFLSVCGEHLSVDNMTQGIQHLQRTLGLHIREFTVSAVSCEQTFAHRWYIGYDEIDKNKLDANKVNTLLDDHLKSINDDYATERSAMLRPIQVNLVPNDLFYRWLEHLGKIGGQAKVPRVMQKNQFADWEDFVKKQNF